MALSQPIPRFVGLHRRRHRFDYQGCLLFENNGNNNNNLNPGIGNSFMYCCSLSDNLEVTTPLIQIDMGWFPPDPIFPKWPIDEDDDDDDDDDDASHDTPFESVLGPLNNGIHCCIYHDRQRPKQISVGTSRLAVCNLATREYKFANPFPSDALSDIARRSPSQVHYGFGSVHDQAGVVVDNKVVVIILSGYKLSRFVSYVYSLQRGSWDKIAHVRYGMLYSSDHNKAVAAFVNRKGELQTPRCIASGLASCTQCFLNGSWHFLEVLIPRANNNDRVLLFDVADEVFRVMTGPPHDYHGRTSHTRPLYRGLLLLDDRLAAVYMPHDDEFNPQQNKRRYRCIGFDVWIMMEYGVKESWTKIYSCKSPAAFYCSFPSVVGISHRKDVIDKIFLEVAGGRVVSWDGSRFTDHGIKSGLWNTLGVSTYVETLETLTLPPHTLSM